MMYWVSGDSVTIGLFGLKIRDLLFGFLNIPHPNPPFALLLRQPPITITHGPKCLSGPFWLDYFFFNHFVHEP